MADPAGRAIPARACGLVYLLHFSQVYVPYPEALPCACARHYTGFAAGGPRALNRRLAKHGTAEGARLMLAVARAGITWELARTWPGDRARERQLKTQGGAARRCPLCGVTPRPGPLPRNADGSISRTLTTEAQRAAAGLMTAALLAEHAELRGGAACGILPRPLERGPLPAGGDPWAVPAMDGDQLAIAGTAAARQALPEGTGARHARS